MGQTSSQLAPTQATQPARPSQSTSPSQWTTAPTSFSGQYMSLANDDEGRPAKRPKLARARPQHKRGVNIQPDMGTVSSQSPEKVVEISRKTRGKVTDTEHGEQDLTDVIPPVSPNADHTPAAHPVPALEEVDAVLGAVDSASTSIHHRHSSPIDMAPPAPATPVPAPATIRRVTRASTNQAPKAAARPQTSEEVIGNTSRTVIKEKKRKRPHNLRINVPAAPVDKLPKLVAPANIDERRKAVPQQSKPRPSQEDPDEWVEKMINTKPKLKQLTATGMTVDIAGYEATITNPPETHAEHVDRWLANSDFTRPPSQRSISHSPEPTSHMERVQPTESCSNAPEVRESVHALSQNSPVEESRPVEEAGPIEDNLLIAETPSVEDRRPAERTRDLSSLDAMTDSGADDSRPSAMRNLQHVGRGARGGPWSQEEIQLADDIWDDYVKRHNLRDSDLRLKTIKWSKIGAIKRQMYEAFPDRTLETIRKFCQRHFTPYNSGPWTQEEDELLRHEYALHPAQWTLISSALMRSPQCVRDRWRNNTQDHATRLTGAWTEEEEHMLGGVLRRLWESMMEDPIGAGKTEAELDACIDWNLVNVRMGGTRSARRCYEKWQTMKIRLYEADDPDYHAPAPAAPPRSAMDGATQLTKHQRARENQYSRLGWGDVFDALADITVTMGSDLDQTYKDESTFWSQVATRAGQVSKYFGDPKMRRRCYEGALVKVGYYHEVAKAVGIARKAVTMQHILLILEEKGNLTLERKYERKRDQKQQSTEDATEIDAQAAEVDASSAHPRQRAELHGAERKLSRREKNPAVGKFSKARAGRLSRSAKKLAKKLRKPGLEPPSTDDATSPRVLSKKRKRASKLAEMEPPAKKQRRAHDLVNGVSSRKRLSEALVIDSDED